MEQVARELPDVRVVKVDVEAASKAAEKYAITAVPTMIIFQDGEEANRIIGAVPKKQIMKRLWETLRAES